MMFQDTGHVGQLEIQTIVEMKVVGNSLPTYISIHLTFFLVTMDELSMLPAKGNAPPVY